MAVVTRQLGYRLSGIALTKYMSSIYVVVGRAPGDSAKPRQQESGRVLSASIASTCSPFGALAATAGRKLSLYYRA
ncbi:hypothetical protein BHE74_00009764 [Ensete ventricosum]|nr:hypothetical protein GW17_00032980 [Ensete ventricosum]RWW81813.1 hypothetical protein BHE74_00009764 [Ensete ventricosum]RZS23121.1 hypothetical protein BHM03_00055988 [Ensete ventricosum]